MNSDEAELLAQISGTISRVEDRQETHAAGFTKRLDNIDVILQGEGGEAGLKGDVAQLKHLVGTDLPVRVDRLEQKEAGRAKLAWIAIAGGLTSALAWLSTHWAGHK